MVTVATPSLPVITVDDLARMTTREATELYKNGTVPSMTALDGESPGRMLAIAGLGHRAVAARLAKFASSGAFPWAGKSFRSSGSDTGTGVNRVRLFGGRDWIPFDTLVGPSAVDGQPAIILNYDRPGNPWFVRKIYDELREVSPGLFLGPGMWKTSSGPRHLLYFAIDKQ